jgi:hypothetical protein
MALKPIREVITYNSHELPRNIFKYVEPHSNIEQDFIFASGTAESMVLFPTNPRKIKTQIRIPEMRHHISKICKINYISRLQFVYILYNAHDKSRIEKIINRLNDKQRTVFSYEKALCMFASKNNIETYMLEKVYDCIQMYINMVEDDKSYNHKSGIDIEADFDYIYNRKFKNRKRKSDSEISVAKRPFIENPYNYGPPGAAELFPPKPTEPPPLMPLMAKPLVDPSLILTQHFNRSITDLSIDYNLRLEKLNATILDLKEKNDEKDTTIMELKYKVEKEINNGNRIYKDCQYFEKEYRYYKRKYKSVRDELDELTKDKTVQEKLHN